MWWFFGIGAYFALPVLVSVFVVLFSGVAQAKELLPVSAVCSPVAALFFYLGWRLLKRREAVLERALSLAHEEAIDPEAIAADLGLEEPKVRKILSWAHRKGRIPESVTIAGPHWLEERNGQARTEGRTAVIADEASESYEIRSTGKLGVGVADLWQLQFSDAWLSFVSKDRHQSFRVLRNSVKEAIKVGTFMPGLQKTVLIQVDTGAGMRPFRVPTEVAQRIIGAKPRRSVPPLDMYLRGWGIALLVLAVAHFILPFLDPMWGGIMLVLGVLNLIFVKKGMVLVNGIAIIVVGCLNISTALSLTHPGPGGLGLLQVIWGIWEFVNFKSYRENA